MGNKIKDTKLMLKMIEGTIHQLEKRRTELIAEIDPETGELPLNVQKELGWVNQNLSLIRSMKKDAEEVIRNARSEEEKKKITNVMALAMLVGAVNENLRTYMEQTEKRNPHKNFLIAIVEALFETDRFRYITQYDVEDILADEELRRMAEEDPGKLHREELDYKAEYEKMMTRAMSNAGFKVGDDFEENEEKFREYLKRNNGFEFVMGRNSKFINGHIMSGKVGTEEDRRHFEEVMKEINDLSTITRGLQEQYILGDDSFEKGNGYTRELIEREKALVRKIEAYSQKVLNRVVEPRPGVKEYDDGVLLYKRSQMLLTPVSEQQKRDSVLQRNNDLRRRMERWMVYQQLPDDNRPKILVESVKIQNRKNAVSKLQRMERMAIRGDLDDDYEMSEDEIREKKDALMQGKEDLRSDMTAWAVEETQNLLERLDSDDPLTTKDIKTVREYLAAVVLNNLIMDEIKELEDEPKYFYDKIKTSVNQNTFRKLARELSEMKEFKNAVDPLIKGKNIVENVYRFLANDFEKNVAGKICEPINTRMQKQKVEKEKQAAKSKKDTAKTKDAGIVLNKGQK